MSKSTVKTTIIALINIANQYEFFLSFELSQSSVVQIDFKQILPVIDTEEENNMQSRFFYC